MVSARFVFGGIVAVTGVSASLTEERMFAALLKRQEPGTPAYNCHDNCGTAITISKASSDVCKDDAFLANYKNCIQCAGPDNVNIWRYYGGTLGAAGSECGLSTTPLSGKQPDVPPATHAGGAVSSAEGAPSSTAPALSSAAPVQSSAAPTSSGAPAPTPTSDAIESAASSVAGVVSSVAATVSGIPTGAGNGTASFTASSPPQQTTNAASFESVNAAGLFGAVVMGMMYGFGN
ncbi:hypothetical protein K469DRAFT_674040 [Zopfia rhizophila CBS 207.26]|uniref:Uncharacterized protein n=1 Tax=Zopfia rhizophila CBS 207.26 TaxID=1314779 RepID=A0A6A6DM66_9PEZI|nr:hypothetical protein K469DRAFT_674040 [Zopfia rhizophila CBS 207.26]